MSDKSHQIYCYFWLFGLINNVLYVVILSAAVDIVGPTLPKSLVLLADIFPSLAIKLCSPFFIDRIKYSYRIWSLITMSCLGMFLVSFKNLVCLSFRNIFRIYIFRIWRSDIPTANTLLQTNFFKWMVVRYWWCRNPWRSILYVLNFNL